MSTRPRPNRQPRSGALALPAPATLITATRLTCSAGDPAAAAGPVRVEGQAVPWGVTVTLNWWGDTVEFAPGSITVEHPWRIPFMLDHGAHAMGFGVSFTADDAGLQAVMEIPREEVDSDERTTAAVRQMANGVRTALSIGAMLDAADVDHGKDHDHYVVSAARLLELSSVLVPRFDDARISSIAASTLTHGGSYMSTVNTAAGLPAFPRSTSAPLALDAGDPGDPDDSDDGDDGDDSDEVQAAAGRRHPANLRPTTAALPYQTRRARGRDTTLAGVARLLASTGGDPRLVRAALADVGTTDVPGLMRPQYVDELVGLLQLGTPAINAFRQANLTSNPIVWPFWTTLPIVDKQATQKSQIATGPVRIDNVQLQVDTYAGGNDVSVQTIDWSSPAFLEAYFQAATEVYARKIEGVFEAALATWATGVATTGNLIGDIGAAIGAVAGKGLPGRFLMLVSGDVFGDLFVSLANAGPGMFSVLGADFPTPAVVVCPFFPANTLITAMAGTAITYQNAGVPVRLRAVDVSLLGVDLGVYGYFAAALLYPGTLRKVTGLTARAGGLDFDEAEWTGPLDLLHPGDRTPPTDPAPAPKTSTKSA